MLSTYNEKGEECPSDVPTSVTVKLRPSSSSADLRRMIREELSRAAAEQGIESFEEADDFDVGEDYDPQSPWELQADQADAEIAWPEAKPEAPPPEEPQPGTNPSPGDKAPPSASGGSAQ